MTTNEIVQKLWSLCNVFGRAADVSVRAPCAGKEPHRAGGDIAGMVRRTDSMRCEYFSELSFLAFLCS